MLDNFRKIDVTWDKASRKIYELIKTASSDENGRKLVVQVLDGGQVEDLSGTSLHLYWETANEKNKGLDAFEEVDASKGIFQIYFTTEMASNVGTLTAHLHLVDDQGTVTSEPFKISVFKGVDNDTVESSNSFSSLTKILIEARNLEENYAPQLAELKENDESITAQLAQTAQQVNILDDVKMSKTEGATKTELQQETNNTKIYLDNQLSQIGSMTPKGAYPTLQDLESEYPNGENGVFVVQENGHWYYWNGSNWTDGGDYQAQPWDEFMTEENQGWSVV